MTAYETLQITRTPEFAIVVNSRAERGPLESVIAALGDRARVVGVEDVPLASRPSFIMAACLTHFHFEFQAMKPRAVIVLGDRYETLAAALAAMFLRIPIAHIHGGETTTGAFDDALRHSITHLTEQSGGIHLVPTEDAAIRVGELTAGHGIVRLVGAPGLDGIPRNSANRDVRRFLVTFHPETMADDYGLALCKRMLEALDRFPNYEVTICGVNNDPGADAIKALLLAYADSHVGTVAWLPHMDHASYVREMQHAALVIGNSSAGIIEAPWVGVPTVNIGNRQDGRPMACSVCQFDRKIALAIEEALRFADDPMPTYCGDAAPKIVAALETLKKKAPAG